MELCQYNQNTTFPIYNSCDGMNINSEVRFYTLGFVFAFNQFVLLGLFIFSIIAKSRIHRLENSVDKLDDDSATADKMICTNIECIHQLQQSITNIDNQFICVGVLNMGDPHHQPFYIEKNCTYLRNDGWIQGNVRYLILSQLCKTQIKVFDVYMLFNVSFKIYAEEETPHSKIDMSVPSSTKSLLDACFFLKKKNIKIKLTGNPNIDLNIKTTVYNKQIDEMDSFFSLG